MKFCGPRKGEKLEDLLHQYNGSRIQLQETGGTLRLRGRLVEIGELDICGRILIEAYLSLEFELLYAHLTFHDELLGVQILEDEKKSDPNLLIALEVPYERLSIENLDEHRGEKTS
ncbi:MAG: hypothetical protein VX399_05915, partial [SAR324 cluster bacterium]|nr:hypothetical protein [SAR324 cluster bacterium]